MPHQIVAAVNAAGKRMPMCSYPEQMHNFQAIGLPTTTDDGGTRWSAMVACTRCGAELRLATDRPWVEDAAARCARIPLEDINPPEEAAKESPDDPVVRYWPDRSERT